MVANPEITNVIATKSGSTIRCLVAIRNNLATEGMVQTLFSEYSGGICTTLTYFRLFNCILPSISPYISNTQWILTASFIPAIMPSTLCVRTYQCNLNEDCPGVACTAYSSAAYSTKTNVYVDYGLGVVPGTITNISATPGDRNLVFKWTPPTNAPVTYYGIALYKGTTLLQSGYILYNTSSGLVVHGLQNGTEYKLDVFALSDDGFQGIDVSITGTPISPTLKWKCSGSPNYTCTQAIDGTYDTQAACISACISPTLKWKCSDAVTNTCIQASDGTFDTEAICKASTTCQPDGTPKDNTLIYVAAAGVVVLYLLMKKK